MASAAIFSSDNRTVQLDGERLKALRRERALTRESLVDTSAGPHRLSLATIKRAEGGLPVYLETARRLAALLSVSLSAILPAGPLRSAPLRRDDSALRLYDAGSLRLDDAGSGDLERAPSAVEAGLALAVLPFRTIGLEPGTRTLAEGLVEDLTIRLGYNWFPVICCNSTRSYSSAEPSSQVRAQLLADYLVLGSVQRSGSAVRVRVRLVRSETGEQIWQKEFHRDYSAVFALQDELSNVILDGVHGSMLALASRRLQHRDPTDFGAWELTVLGGSLFQEGTREQNERAREHVLQSVKRDAGISWAWYLLAQTYQQDLIHQWTSTPRQALQSLQEVASEFERQHAGDARAALVAAYALLYQGRRDAARESVQQAIESGPNLSRAYCLYGQILAMANDPDRALEQLEMAVRLSPRDGQLWAAQMSMALSHFVAERHDEALRWAESAAQLKPELPFTQATLASLRAWAGDIDSAKRAVAHLARIHPAMSSTGFGVINASTDPEIAKRFLEGLRRAGLPG